MPERSSSRLGRTLQRLAKRSLDIELVSQQHPPPLQRTSSGDTRERRDLSNTVKQLEQMFDWRTEMSRPAKYQAYREMDAEVPELNRSVQTRADFVFGAEDEADQIRWLYQDSARAEVRKIADELFLRLDPPQNAPRMYQEAAKMGDAFGELIWSRSGSPYPQLLAVKEILPERVQVLKDHLGNTKGYNVVAPGITTASKGAFFSPQEMVQFSVGKAWTAKYGTSIYEPARRLWPREQATLDVLSLLTIMRASARKSVAYPVGSLNDPKQLQEWKEKLSDGNLAQDLFDGDGNLVRRLVSRLELDDLIYPYRSDHNPPVFHDEPAADLKQLLDVLHYYQERYFVVTGTPAGLAGLERNVNARSTLEQQGLYFVRMVMQGQKDIRRFYEGLLRKQLAFAGISWIEGEVQMQLPTVTKFDAELQSRAKKASVEQAEMMLNQGYDPEWVAVNVVGVRPDQLDSALSEAGREPREPIGNKIKPTAQPEQDRVKNPQVRNGDADA
jgi:hypothetical protein